MGFFTSKTKKEEDYYEPGFWPAWSLPLPYELKVNRERKAAAKRKASKPRKRG